jgi:uncharacterized protein (TIGR02453 family)
MGDRFQGFPAGTLKFLRGLEKHNDKTWFDAHRDDYDAFYVDVAKQLVSALGPGLRKISKTVNYEPRVNGSIFRINRDVRFSKDKSPYKPHLDLWFWEGDRRGWETPGFFFRLAAGELVTGAGMHVLPKDRLDTYRAAVIDPKSGKALERIAAEVKKAGATLGGATRKTVPRGMDASHARAGFLLHEGLYATVTSTPPRTLSSPRIVDDCLARFRATAPVSRWLQEHVIGR